MVFPELLFLQFCKKYLMGEVKSFFSSDIICVCNILKVWRFIKSSKLLLLWEKIECKIKLDSESLMGDLLEDSFLFEPYKCKKI